MSKSKPRKARSPLGNGRGRAPRDVKLTTRETLADIEKTRAANPSQADMREVFGREVERPDGSFGGTVDLRDPKKRGAFIEMMRPLVRAQTERGHRLRHQRELATPVNTGRPSYGMKRYHTDGSVFEYTGGRWRMVKGPDVGRD